MPTILRINNLRFHFYSDEGKEPAHIHVATPDGECKFWLNPIRLAGNMNVKPHEIKEIEKLVYDNVNYLIEKFHEYHFNRK